MTLASPESLNVAEEVRFPVTYLFAEKGRETLSLSVSETVLPLARLWADFIVEAVPERQPVRAAEGYLAVPSFILDFGGRLVKGNYDDGRASEGDLNAPAPGLKAATRAIMKEVIV